MGLDSRTVVGVVGAGTMGAGIAQLAASRGHDVLLTDAAPQAIKGARRAIRSSLDRGVEKGKLTREAADAALRRITFLEGAAEDPMANLAPCGLVVEAVVEDLAVKEKVFARLESTVGPEAVLATNTSSLSIARLASACRDSERVLGMHFFNPAPVMPLVEIVGALTTEPSLVQEVRQLMEAWGKTPVVASDTPGFIVNRIARPFYGEALRIAEEGIAGYATIDWAMRELAGFRMGPFELMDFIGNDVNYTVSCSVFEAMYFEPRYRPSLVQRRLVEAGFLGRKSDRGYYDYREGAPRPSPDQDAALGRSIVDRIVAMLVNEAAEALRLGVATAADIELAMTKGVNYPKGLLAWGDELGPDTVLRRLRTLQEEYGEERYRASPLLRRLAREGGHLLP